MSGLPPARPVANRVEVKVRVEARTDGPRPFVDIDFDGRRLCFLPDLARGLALDLHGALGQIERFEKTYAERHARAGPPDDVVL